MTEIMETPDQDAPSAELLGFFSPLRRDFEPRRRALLEARRRALRKAHAGEMPGYLPPSEATAGAWRVSVPAWALDQRNQITGPADNAKLLVAMCNTKDPGCMPDGEDSITTDWANVRAAHRNTIAAIDGALAFNGTAIKPSGQVMFYRPRGLALDEANALPGETVSGALFDLAAVFFGTADRRRGGGGVKRRPPPGQALLLHPQGRVPRGGRLVLRRPGRDGDGDRHPRRHDQGDVPHRVLARGVSGR